MPCLSHPRDEKPVHTIAVRQQLQPVRSLARPEDIGKARGQLIHGKIRMAAEEELPAGFPDVFRPRQAAGCR